MRSTFLKPVSFAFNGPRLAYFDRDTFHYDVKYELEKLLDFCQDMNDLASVVQSLNITVGCFSTATYSFPALLVLSTFRRLFVYVKRLTLHFYRADSIQSDSGSGAGDDADHEGETIRHRDRGDLVSLSEPLRRIGDRTPWLDYLNLKWDNDTVNPDASTFKYISAQWTGCLQVLALTSLREDRVDATALQLHALTELYLCGVDVSTKLLILSRLTLEKLVITRRSIVANSREALEKALKEFPNLEVLDFEEQLASREISVVPCFVPSLTALTHLRLTVRGDEGRIDGALFADALRQAAFDLHQVYFETDLPELFIVVVPAILKSNPILQVAGFCVIVDKVLSLEIDQLLEGVLHLKSLEALVVHYGKVSSIPEPFSLVERISSETNPKLKFLDISVVLAYSFVEENRELPANALLLAERMRRCAVRWQRVCSHVTGYDARDAHRCASCEKLKEKYWLAYRTSLLWRGGSDPASKPRKLEAYMGI